MPVKTLLLLLASATIGSPVAEQDASSLVARDDSAYAVFNAEEALTLYESALPMDSSNADALAKASRTAVDVAESLTDAAWQKELFRKGERYARLAVSADSTSADNWFHLARALGRTALSVGVRDRVRYAVEIRRCAQYSLAINPNHGGPLLVVGMWDV